jgi:fibronectin-binding autotransporter adhesin
VAAGGQLYVTANVNLGWGLTLNGVGDNNGALRKGGAGLTVSTAPVALAADSTIGLDGGATLTLSNVVSGTAALTAVGSGTLTLNTNNTFSGGFTLNGPTVGLDANGALGTNEATVAGAGHFLLGAGVAIATPIHATTVNPGSANGLIMVNDNTNGTVTTVSGPLTFDVSPGTGGDFMGPASSGYLNVTGPITNAATGVVSSRNGRVRFSGGGSYTSFVLNQGTASLGANNGLSTNAALTIGSSGNATFDLNGFDQTLTGLADGAANSNLVINGSATPGTVTFNVPGANTYNGVLAGNLALVVNGPGNLLLNGTNTYTGNTTVNGGTLELAQPALAAGSTVAVASGATLQLDFTTTNQVAGLKLNGVSQPFGVYNTITSPTFIIGLGSLRVAAPARPAVFTQVSLSGTTLTIAGTNGVAGGSYVLLGSTNVALPLSQWIPLLTNTFDGSGNFNLSTNIVNPAQPQEFYFLSQ